MGEPGSIYLGNKPRRGDYEVRVDYHADEDEQGRTIAYEVWNWQVEIPESNWPTAALAFTECLRLSDA